MSRIVNSGEVKGLADNLFDPVRGLIPLAVVDAEATDEIRLAAEDYLLSLATSAAMARDFAALDSIVAQGLADTDVSALHPLLKRIGGDEQKRPSSDREGAAIALWSVREDLSGRPLEFCWTGVWLVINAYGSRLQAGFVGPLVAWIFAGADHLVRNARFSLSLPAVTVPPVEAVLADPERTLASASRLLLALGPAVATNFAEPVRKRLELVAEG